MQAEMAAARKHVSANGANFSNS